MTALYNENDPFAAAWLRNLITAGHIAPGVVDDRSIAALEPADVAGLGQRHFFAGIGGWSHALRLAGVQDDASIWTGSCPCQPFSDAGRKRGTADDRHLWPEWFRLIRECRPAVVLGEQVASRAGLGWLDLVFADMEGAGYACAAADLCAASVGAPHIRQRLFFVAYADGEHRGLHVPGREPGRADAQARRSGEARDVANPTGCRWQEGLDGGEAGAQRGIGPADDRRSLPANAIESRLEVVGEQQARRQRATAERGGAAERVGDASSAGAGRDTGAIPGSQATSARERSVTGSVTHEPVDAGPGYYWSACEWVQCSDGVARAVEPGVSPLVTGLSGRVGLLRGYGNSIVPQVAAAFIQAALSARWDR